MNTRFRLLIIGFGALLVALTFSFPIWYPLTQNQGEVFPFPELDPALQDAFSALPVDRQQDYLALRRTSLEQALEMATAALQPDAVVPDEQQVLPENSGQQPGRTGKFIGVTPNRSAVGEITVYELPDGSHYLWFEDFSAIKGPDLRVYLSTEDSTILEDRDEEKEPGPSPDDIILGRLHFNVGNQQFKIPSEATLSLFNSVILFDQRLNLIYSIADF